MNKFEYGCWNIISDPFIVRTLANELDFLFVDLEHGFRDFKDLTSALIATQNANSDIYVRVRNYRDPWIQSLLDLGVTRFIIPQIRKVSEIEEFLQASTFPPAGRRGLHPRVYQSTPTGRNTLKDILISKIKVCVIIETKESLELLEELCANPQIDEIYLGVYDLSMELGIVNGTDSEEMLAICAKISKTAERFAKPLIAMATNHSVLKKLSLIGVSKFVIGIDSSMLQESARSTVRDFRDTLDSNLA